ncbi:MATE family efflux transporter [Vallitalea sediminicola]
MSENRKALLEMNMGKLFMKLAIPGIIGMLAVGLYNMVDAIFVGQFVSGAGVGAITMAYNIVLINQAILTLFATGAMSLLSRALGEKDEETINKLFGNVIIGVAIISGILTIIICLFATPILQFLGAKDEILVLGEKYIRIIALGFIFGGVGPALNMLIRGEGKMKAAMKIVFIGMIINIILDPIFIIVFGMGIEGAAIATVISQIIYLIGDIVYFKSGKSVIKLTKKSIKISMDVMPKMLSVGFSGMLMQVMSAIQLAILLRLMSSYGGNNSIIVLSSAQRIMMFAFIPMWGIGQGLQPILGANYGAKQFARVKEAFVSFTKIATWISGILWLLFMLLPKFILGWFITDSALVSEGVNSFRMYLCVFVLYGLMITSITLYQALGKAGKAALIVMGRQILFFIPLSLILPLFMKETGVWLALPIGDFLTISLSIVFTIGEFTALNKQIKGYNNSFAKEGI